MKPYKFEEHILHEDQDYLVLNKPSGISALADRKEDDNLLEWARKHRRDCQLAHRLDKLTSGAIILAKNPQAYRHVSLQFQNRQVAKIYHAVVHGRHQFKNHELSAPLVSGRRGITHVSTLEGKEAVTIFDTMDIYKAHSLISCKPITGRTHQIRAHLSHLNAPIVADLNYGGEAFYLSQVKPHYNLKKYTEERPLMSRLALHAANLSFQLLNGTIREITAPYPKDFRALLNQLGKYRPYQYNHGHGSS